MELYLHIPFCVRKCAYCSFVSFPAAAEEKDAYVASLLREAELRQSEADGPVDVKSVSQFVDHFKTHVVPRAVIF